MMDWLRPTALQSSRPAVAIKGRMPVCCELPPLLPSPQPPQPSDVQQLPLLACRQVVLFQRTAAAQGILQLPPGPPLRLKCRRRSQRHPLLHPRPCALWQKLAAPVLVGLWVQRCFLSQRAGGRTQQLCCEQLTLTTRSRARSWETSERWWRRAHHHSRAGSTWSVCGIRAQAVAGGAVLVDGAPPHIL